MGIISDADCEKIQLFVYNKLVDEGVPVLLTTIKSIFLSNGIYCNSAFAEQNGLSKLVKRIFCDQRKIHNKARRKDGSDF